MRYRSDRQVREVAVRSSDRGASGLVAAGALAALVLLIVALSATGAFAGQPLFGLVR